MKTWGEAQAERYIRGLFERFQAIADRKVSWRPIPVELGVDGYVCRYEAHYVYWKVLADGAVGIVTVLHQRMHQRDRSGRSPSERRSSRGPERNATR